LSKVTQSLTVSNPAVGGLSSLVFLLLVIHKWQRAVQANTNELARAGGVAQVVERPEFKPHCCKKKKKRKKEMDK
jgi:hypothetical protein